MFKAITTVTPAGTPTISTALYAELFANNVFRGLSRPIKLPKGPSVNLTELSGITAQHEANVPTAINLASGHAGDVNNRIVTVSNWTSRFATSNVALDDLEGLDQVIVSLMMDKIAEVEAEDSVAQIIGDSRLTNNVVTGVAHGDGGLPSVLDPLSDMPTELIGRYKRRGAAYMVSRGLMGALRKMKQNSGDSSDLTFLPNSRIMMLHGYPIIENDYMADGDTANDVVALFGDFYRGTVFVDRQSMKMTRSSQTIPGATYYHGNCRSKSAVFDEHALVKLTVGTS